MEIAVAAPIDQTLTYRLPVKISANPDGDGTISLIGRRVLVPLGGRKVTGYVLAEDVVASGEFKIRDIAEVLDVKPVFPCSLIALFRWISNYYHYPIGEVIRAALPAGMSPRSVRCLELVDSAREDERFLSLPDEKWRITLQEKGSLSAAATKELLASKVWKKTIQQFIKLGVLRLCESVTSDGVKEKMEVCYRLQHWLPQPSVDLPDESEIFQHYRRQLDAELGLELKLSEAKTLYYMKGLEEKSVDGTSPRKELLELYAGAAKGICDLKEKRLVTEQKKRVFRSPLGERLEFFPAPTELTDEQNVALAEIVPAIEQGGYTPFLLHGVTGSGKTEVYLQATAAALRQGKSVLVIVPEIALATQLEAHFVSRFGEQVVLLHSGLSASERFDQWSLAMSGEAKIVIGARSAIFAPLNDLGLIVVDEEHDAGLKQDDSLRYNGRDLAVVRAKQQGIVVLLASATPSVVSYHNALCGKYRLLTMDNRVGNRSLPKVTLIDLRKQQSSGKRSLFRPQLRKALEENFIAGRQSVILINRRGFSSNVLCQECGTPVQCRDCHVTLTLHRSTQQLLCHYCGYSVHEKTVCESCGSMQLVPVGFGTERVETELQEMLPLARVARLDTDTAKDRKAFLQTLKLMRGGEIDILVGTQMVAKGHHFPGVTLVGVVWADGGLAIPDYRAAEKTFQLITQVTGRAGRGDSPGEVYIQTMRPEHYAISLARTHSYRHLVEKELELRKNPAFPPFVRLVAIHIQGESEQDVERSASRIAAACRAAVKEKKSFVEILGPAPSPIDRVKKNYRWQVMIKAASIEILDALCSYVRQNQQELVSGRCKVMLDKDPENMM
ncbi:replication restart helicase PriA [Desulfopila aestuarii]|uniref:replication restart helicase PriA n=1 Tax=Desulfopila aestuarii TaxID=231440 RepID=UPI0013563AF0|nr:primosomal protein N' [Desulfopila aestuarii]